MQHSRDYYTQKNAEIRKRFMNIQVKKNLHDERVKCIKEYNKLCKEALEEEMKDHYGEDFYTPIYTPKSNTQSK